jgi:signal transduction histidine kinase
MTGTNHATSGFRRITRKRPLVKVRLWGFILLVACGSVILFWLTRTTWSQLDRLQREHAAVKGESFYLGVHLRGAIRSLNDKLLQFGLAHDPETLNAFLQESADLKGWIATNRAHVAQMANLQLLRTFEISGQLQLLSQAEVRYDRYLTNAAAILASNTKGHPRESFEAIYKQVREASNPLFPVCEELVKAQRLGFGEFLGETQVTLVNHQRLLQLTSVLILGLALALGVQVYRGMIAPLRVSLSESKSIIERQEKLASLGILASGVAHEIRNPLTAIKLRLFSLKKALPDVARNEDVTLIGTEINRLERIVKDFLQFARPSEPELARIPATQILQQVRELIQPQLERSGIDLMLESSNGGLVHADAQQLKQVLINLIQNSAENIGRNGTITLRLRHESAELNGRTKPAVILVVEDTGKGIPPEVEMRLFDPFFTTKEGGTGLGLAISARIVEKHGGLLRYQTKLNQGTIFEVVVPEVKSDAAKHTPD